MLHAAADSFVVQPNGWALFSMAAYTFLVLVGLVVSIQARAWVWILVGVATFGLGFVVAGALFGWKQLSRGTSQRSSR